MSDINRKLVGGPQDGRSVIVPEDKQFYFPPGSHNGFYKILADHFTWRETIVDEDATLVECIHWEAAGTIATKPTGRYLGANSSWRRVIALHQVPGGWAQTKDGELLAPQPELIAELPDPYNRADQVPAKSA